MTVRDPDPWANECPSVNDVTREQLRDFLEAAEDGCPLSDWEYDFCMSVRGRLRFGRPSIAQSAVLDKGLLHKLWANDPALWGVENERDWKIAQVRLNNAKWAAKLNNRPFLDAPVVVDDDDDNVDWSIGKRK